MVIIIIVFPLSWSQTLKLVTWHIWCNLFAVLLKKCLWDKTEKFYHLQANTVIMVTPTGKLCQTNVNLMSKKLHPVSIALYVAALSRKIGRGRFSPAQSIMADQHRSGMNSSHIEDRSSLIFRYCGFSCQWVGTCPNKRCSLIKREYLQRIVGK